MALVKGEKHAFTNNSSYMTTLEKMKEYVMEERNYSEYKVVRQGNIESKVKLESFSLRVSASLVYLSWVLLDTHQ